jgi:hypothetical protein
LIKTNYISFKDKWNLYSFFKYLLKNESELTDYTILDVCKKLEINDEVIKRFLTPLVVSIMNLPINIAHVSVFIITIKTILSAGKSGLVLTYCKENFGKLFAPFVEKINETDNNNLYLQTKVKDFYIENGVCKGVILSDGTIKEADAVISTITPKDYKSIKEFDYIKQTFPQSTILSAYFWINERLNLKSEYNAIIGTDIDWIFDINTENNIKSNIYMYRITISNFTKFKKNVLKDLKIFISEELEKIFDKKIEKNAIQVISQTNATSLISTQNNKLRPNTHTHIKKLYIAGDWTNTGLPTCIESAALSGYLAMKEIDC